MLAELYIELTNLCNCKCVTCPQSVYKCGNSSGFNRDKGIMNMNLFDKLLSQAWEITQTINFSYFGEPTLHPNFCEIMDKLRDRPKNKKVHIFSNFVSMTKNHMDSIIDAKVDHLNISLDAVTESMYNRVRCGEICLDLDGCVKRENRFEIVDSKVKYWFSRPDHIPTRHEYTKSHYNDSESDLFVRKWRILLSERDTIVVKNVLTYGGVMLDEPMIKPFRCDMFCDNKFLVVAWNGKVGPCYLDINMELCVGDANIILLKDIMESSEKSKVQLVSASRSIKPCSTCVDANNHQSDIIYRKL